MEPTSYEDCQEIWKNSKRHKMANNTYLIQYEKADYYAIRLHSTDVMTFDPDGGVTLHTGGWETVTTKERINRYLPEGFGVFQQNFKWWLSDHRRGWDRELRYSYRDGMHIDRNGDVS